METIFDAVYTHEKKMSPSEIQDWMGSIQSSQKSGVARFYRPPDERLILFLYRGNWQTSYPDDAAGGVDFNGDMFARFIPLSPYGLIHSNLLVHAEFHQYKRGFKIMESPVSVRNPGSESEPYLIKMKWSNASGSILFNGVSNMPHSLFISEDMVLDEVGISAPILQWKDDPSCAVTLFSPDATLDAWQELRLRVAFKLLYERLLERFELLTGRIIIDSFARIVESFSFEQKVDISITKRQLTNNEFFLHSQDAARQYTIYLGELLSHFSAVIGPRLLASNLREIFHLLPEDSRTILRTYTIVPEGYLP
jgi:hypothetical protein